MKTRSFFFMLICLLFSIPSFLNAQIVPQMKQVAGREVKTKVWKDKEVKFAAKEIAVKIAPYIKTENIDELLLITGGKIINIFDELGWGLIELPDGKDELLTIDEVIKLPFIVYAGCYLILS